MTTWFYPFVKPLLVVSASKLELNESSTSAQQISNRIWMKPVSRIQSKVTNYNRTEQIKSTYLGANTPAGSTLTDWVFLSISNILSARVCFRLAHICFIC